MFFDRANTAHKKESAMEPRRAFQNTASAKKLSNAICALIEDGTCEKRRRKSPKLFQRQPNHTL